MVLALLSTPEQLKNDKKGMNVVLDKILQLIINAAHPQRRQHSCYVDEPFQHEGFHIYGPLRVLVKMFVVEERTLDYTLCHAETEPPSDMHSTIRLFISLFFEFSNALKGIDPIEHSTLRAILNILWSISFHPIYGKELVNDEKFIETIRIFTEDSRQHEAVEQYTPRSMEGIKSAAHGILHNLNQNIQTHTTSEEKREGQKNLVSDLEKQ